MKKIFLITLLTMMFGAAMSYAQTKVATLTHGETVSYFYGDSAFVKAYDAAVNDDEILLSSGSFVYNGIYKAISVRGAGMEEDSLTATAPTILRNTSWNGNNNSEDHPFQIEGVCFLNDFVFGEGNTISPKFVNCMFKGNLMFDNYNYGRNPNVTDAIFIHCKITSGPKKRYITSATGYIATVTATFINCYITGASNVNVDGLIFYDFRNCVVTCDPANVGNSNFVNCIINTTNTNNSFPASTYLSNCVSQSENTFANSGDSSNKIAEMKELFEGQDMPLFNRPNKLTEAAATTYLGTDGTQVGIWGGSLPFNPIPNGPRVKNLTVGNQQADGKLKVTVEVQ